MKNKQCDKAKLSQSNEQDTNWLSASWLQSEEAYQDLRAHSLPALRDELEESKEKLQKQIDQQSKTYPGSRSLLEAETAATVTQLLDKPPRLRSDLVRKYPWSENNQVQLLSNEHKAFKAMLTSINTASSYVHLSFYIFQDDRMGGALERALVRAQRRGVEVRLQVDALGSSLMTPWSRGRKLVKRLRSQDIEVKINPSLRNRPDHRKLCIVDGKRAFTGGMNVDEEYLKPRFSRRILKGLQKLLRRDIDHESIPAAKRYHDLMISISGPVTAQLHSEWLGTWRHLGGALNPERSQDFYFPAEMQDTEATAKGSRARITQTIPKKHTETLNNTLELITEAEHSIHVTSPYLTHRKIQKALITAAEQGRQVNILVPYYNDNALVYYMLRKDYPALLKAGCKVFEYDGFNHGKVLTVDERVTSIGSTNLDYLSANMIYDLNVVIDDPQFSKQCIVNIFNADTFPSVAHKVSLESLSWKDTFFGWFANRFRWLS